MYSFKFYYLEACDNLRIKPSEKLLTKTEESTNSTTLNLSSVELTDDTCKAVGLALRKDVFLQELDLSDCTLYDDGLSSILLGLETNKFLLTLNLKGNNIRSAGTAAIGKFLRHNKHLQNLYLEWNGTGIFPEKFSYLCEGLCINNSLKSLDLRNNQLNHLCAQSLSEVLYRNSTLQDVDLRWNTIGLIGGRAILKSLAKNKSILKLHITGNDVPSEIQKSIELITSIAAERHLKNNESVEKTKIFASKLQELETEQNKQLRSFMEQLEKKDKDISLSQRWSSTKLIQLQETISEKDNVIEDLIKKSQELQKKISLVTEERNSIALSFNEMEIKYKESRNEFQLLLEKELKDKEDIKRKFLEEVGSIKEENLFLKQQIQDLKIIKDSLEDQEMKLKSTITKMEKMSKLEEESFKEQISLLNEKNQENLRENDAIRKNEIARIKDEFSEEEKSLKQRITILENRKKDLEKQVIEKGAESMEIKATAEEMVEELRKKMKSDEDKLKKQMEERIELLESANKKKDDLLRDQIQAMYEIKKKTTESNMLLAEEAHRVQHLQLNLEAKDTEMEASIAKVKLEVKEQLEEFHKMKISFENSLAENTTLKQKIEEMENHYKGEIKEKNGEIENLKNKIAKQKNKVKDILQNENKRIADLQTAFSSYINSVKNATDEVHLEDKLNTDS